MSKITMQAVLSAIRNNMSELAGSLTPQQLLVKLGQATGLTSAEKTAARDGIEAMKNTSAAIISALSSGTNAEKTVFKSLAVGDKKKVQALLTVACGNSIAAQSQTFTGGYVTNCELQMANMLGGDVIRFPRIAATARSDVHGVYGYSGQTLDTINGDIDTQWFAPMHSSNIIPDVVVGLALTENSIIQGRAYIDIVRDLKRWIANVRRFPGVTIVLCTPRVAVQYNSASLVLIWQQVRDYILSLDNGHDIFVSNLNGYEDPALPGRPLAGFTDGIHPYKPAALINARSIAVTLNRITLGTTQHPYRQISSNYGLIGSVTAVGAGTTGTWPTGCSTTGAVASTMVAVAENPGLLWAHSQFSGSGTESALIQLGPTIGITGGANTQVSTYIKVEIVSGAEYLRWLSLNPRIADGSGNNFQSYIAQASNDAPECTFLNGDVLTLRQPPKMAISGTISGVTPYMNITHKNFGTNSTASTGTVIVRVLEAGVGIVVP